MSTTAAVSPGTDASLMQFGVATPPLSTQEVALFKARAHDALVFSDDRDTYLGVPGFVMIQLYGGLLPAGFGFRFSDLVHENRKGIYAGMRNGIRLTTTGDGYVTAYVQGTDTVIARCLLRVRAVSPEYANAALASTTVRYGDATLETSVTTRKYATVLASLVKPRMREVPLPSGPQDVPFDYVCVSSEHVYALNMVRTIVFGDATPLSTSGDVATLDKQVALTLLRPACHVSVKVLPGGIPVVTSGSISATGIASMPAELLSRFNEVLADAPSSAALTVKVTDLAAAWSVTGMPESSLVLSPHNDTHIVASVVAHSHDPIPADVRRSTIIPAVNADALTKAMVFAESADLPGVLGACKKLKITHMDIATVGTQNVMLSGDGIRALVSPITGRIADMMLGSLAQYLEGARDTPSHRYEVPKSALATVGRYNALGLTVGPDGIWVGQHAGVLHRVTEDIPPESTWGTFTCAADARVKARRTIRHAHVSLVDGVWIVTRSNTSELLRGTLLAERYGADTDSLSTAGTVSLQAPHSAFYAALTHLDAMWRSLCPAYPSSTDYGFHMSDYDAIRVMCDGAALTLHGYVGRNVYKATITVAPDAAPVDFTVGFYWARCILNLGTSDDDTITLHYRDGWLRADAGRDAMWVPAAPPRKNLSSLDRMYSNARSLTTMQNDALQALAATVTDRLAVTPDDVAVLNTDTYEWEFRSEVQYRAHQREHGSLTEVAFNLAYLHGVLTEQSQRGDVTLTYRASGTQMSAVHWMSVTDTATSISTIQPILPR